MNTVDRHRQLLQAAVRRHRELEVARQMAAQLTVGPDEALDTALLEANQAGVTQTTLADTLGISQPMVAMRIKNARQRQ